MELTTLKFAVETAALDTAIEKLGQLTVAVEKLNRENDKTSAASTASANASKQQKKATEDLSDSTETLNTASSKAEKLLERLKNTYGDLTSGFTKGESSILNQARAYGIASDALKPFEDQLKLIKELTKDPFDASIGAIRSVQAELTKIQQRGTLAAQGIALTNKQLDEYSRLASEVKGKVIQMGIDPASVEGQAKFNSMLSQTQQEYLGIAKQVNSLTANEKILNETLRESEKIAQSIRQQGWREYAENVGKSSEAILKLNADYAALEAESNKIVAANDRVTASIERTNKIVALVKKGMSEREAGQRVDLASQGVDEASINKLINAEKELIATRQKGVGVDREKLNAIKYIQREEEKLDSVMRELNRTSEDSTRLDEKHARSLANFERNLRLAGISGDEAAVKLKKFRDIQAKLTAEAEARSIKNLQRGLQPQIGDVVVSLASGQNPLTVMLQQGDQIRGLIAQTGVQGEALKKAFQDAMSGTVESIKQTAGAMVNLLGGAIASTGKNMLGLVTGPIAALRDAFKQWKNDTVDLSTAFSTGAITALKSFTSAFLALETVLVGGVIGALAATAVAMYSVTKQSDELTRSLVFNRGVTGLTTDSAYALAASFNDIPKTKALEYIIALGNSGKFTSDEMQKIIPVADESIKYLGLTIKDVVKEFEELKKSPTEALIELQRKTGSVSDDIINMASEAERMGDKTKAGFLAAGEGVRIFKESIETAKKDLTEFGKFMIAVKKYGESFWEGFKSKFSMSKAEKEISELKRNLADAQLNQALFGDSFKVDVEQAQKELDDYNKSISRNSDEQVKAAKKNQQYTEALSNAEKYAKDARTPLDLYLEKIKQLEKELNILTGNEKAQAAVRAEIAKVTKKYNEDLEKEIDKKFKLTEAQKEALAIEKQAEQDRLSFIRIQNQAKGVTDDLTKSQQALLTLMESDKWKKYNDILKYSIILAAAKADQEEKLKKIELDKIKIYNDQYEAYVKLQAARDKAVFDSADKLDDQTRALKDEAEGIQFKISLLGQEEVQQKKLLAIREAQLERDKELRRIGKIDKTGNEEEIARQLQQVEDNYAAKLKNINAEIAMDFSKKMIDEFNTITNGISDAIVTALFEGGQAGKKKLRDLIVAELRKPITMVVTAIIKDISGSFLNSILGGSGSGESTGSSGGIGNISSLFSMFKSGSGWLSSSGFTEKTAGMIGQGASLLSNNGLESAGDWLAKNGGSIAEGLNTVASTVSYLTAFKNATEGKWGAAAGQALGTAFFGPIGGAIGNLIGNLADKYFAGGAGTIHTGGSSKYSAVGGLQTAMGVSGVGQKVGNGSNYSASVEEFTTNLTKGIVTILDKTATTFGKTAGYEAAAGFADDTSKDGSWGSLVISKLGQEIVNWQNTDDKWPGRTFADGTAGSEQYVAAVAADVRKALDDMGLPDWAKSMLDKLGNAPTLTQLTEVVGLINQVQKAFEELGNIMPMFANATADTFDKLSSAVGGVENLANLTSSFYSNFYTDAEKLTSATAVLKKQFDALGIAMPTTRLEYRAKIEKAMADGNETLVATLLQMSSAFASIVPWGEEVVDTGNAVSDTLKSLQEEYANLSIDLLQAQGKTQEAEAAIRSLAINGMTAVEIAAWDANKSLRDQIAAQEAVNKENERIKASLANFSTESKNLAIELLNAQGMTDAAKVATRALAIEGMTALEIAAYDANQSIRDQIAAINASNQAQAEAAAKAKQISDERYGIETQLLQLQGNTTALRERELAALDPSNRALMEQIYALEDKMKADEAAAKAAEDAANAASKAAEEQARAAEEQIRAAEQLKAAWQSITDTIYAEVARIRGLAGTDKANLSVAQSNFDIATAKARAGDQDAAKALPELSKALLELAASQADSLVTLRRIQMYTAASLEQTGGQFVSQYGLTVPAFASGGSYSGGLALVGEQGPELINFNQAGTVYNARSTSAMLGNTNIESLIERLNESVEMLRYEVRAGVSHGAKTAKILDRAMKDGETLSVSFVTAQPVTVV